MNKAQLQQSTNKLILGFRIKYLYNQVHIFEAFIVNGTFEKRYGLFKFFLSHLPFLDTAL